MIKAKSARKHKISHKNKLRIEKYTFVSFYSLIDYPIKIKLIVLERLDSTLEPLDHDVQAGSYNLFIGPKLLGETILLALAPYIVSELIQKFSFCSPRKKQEFQNLLVVTIYKNSFRLIFLGAGDQTRSHETVVFQLVTKA